jgi:uncharacterized protein DUF4349
MRIVPFPRPGNAGDDEVFVAELEAALRGESNGADAESWRELRADVRSLARPMSVEFERALHEQIELHAANPRPPDRGRRSARSALARARASFGSGRRARLIALAGACAIAAAVVLAVAAPWRGSHDARIANAVFSPSSTVSAPRSSAARADELGPSGASSKAAAHARSAQGTNAAASTSEAASARVQQRDASIALAPKPAAVQSVADEVAQLAARDGGFVQSSQVNLHGAGGEATLTLRVPSARLSAALASLGQLAPMRAESQSLQDITDTYDADRAKLADAVAERQALLRALAKASTQGQIESLHARLALAADAIVRARSEYEAISERGNNSAVEVSVRGDAHAGSGRSTLSNGLHAAGDVLKVALALLIVALAVLVPLALLLAAFALGRRATRRRLRERALS